MRVGRLGVVSGPVPSIVVRKTTSAFERMRGLLFSKPLGQDEMLWIQPCASVHMFGMTYPIDVVFINKQGLVLKVCDDLRPWRMATCIGAAAALEMTTGRAGSLGITKGMVLEWLEA